MRLVRKKGKLRSSDDEQEKTYIVNEDKDIITHD